MTFQSFSEFSVFQSTVTVFYWFLHISFINMFKKVGKWHCHVTQSIYARRVKFQRDQSIIRAHRLSLAPIQYTELGYLQLSFSAVQPETPLENADKRQLWCSLAYSWDYKTFPALFPLLGSITSLKWRNRHSSLCLSKCPTNVCWFFFPALSKVQLSFKATEMSGMGYGDYKSGLRLLLLLLLKSASGIEDSQGM